MTLGLPRIPFHLRSRGLRQAFLRSRKKPVPPPTAQSKLTPAPSSPEEWQRLANAGNLPADLSPGPSANQYSSLSNNPYKAVYTEAPSSPEGWQRLADEGNLPADLSTGPSADQYSSLSDNPYKAVYTEAPSFPEGWQRLADEGNLPADLLPGASAKQYSSLSPVQQRVKLAPRPEASLPKPLSPFSLSGSSYSEGKTELSQASSGAVTQRAPKSPSKSSSPRYYIVRRTTATRARPFAADRGKTPVSEIVAPDLIDPELFLAVENGMLREKRAAKRASIARRLQEVNMLGSKPPGTKPPSRPALSFEPVDDSSVSSVPGSLGERLKLYNEVIALGERGE